MDGDLEFFPKRTEKRPLDRFRNQSALLQQFGEDGIRVYDSIDGGRSAAQIMGELGMEEGKFRPIISFMLQNNMVSGGRDDQFFAGSGRATVFSGRTPERSARPVGEQAPPTMPPPPVPHYEQSKPPTQDRKAEGFTGLSRSDQDPLSIELAKQAEGQGARRFSSTPAIQPGQEGQQARIEPQRTAPPRIPEAGISGEPGKMGEASKKTPIYQPQASGDMQAEPQPMAPPSPVRQQSYPREIGPEGRRPYGTGKPGVLRDYPEGIRTIAEQSGPESRRGATGKGAFPPLSPPYSGMGGQAGGEGEPESRRLYGTEKPEALRDYREAMGTIAEQSGSKIAPFSAEREQAQAAPGISSLSPLEKLIYSKYGETGILVYGLIDGQKTAEEIMMETGISEVKLVEILEFMDSQGIIKLERPAEEPMPPEPGKEERQMSPMLEEKELADQPEELSDPLLGIVPVDIAVPNEGNILQKVEVNALLTFKYGKIGPQVLSLIDGKRDFIDMAVAAKLSLPEVDSVMGFVGAHNLATFHPLSREEVKKKYGEDGFAIYKKFGRDGLLLYGLVGREGSLRDIIVSSKVDPEKAVEIFMFIHSVLGLDLPLDREMLHKQLGIKKPPSPPAA